MSNLFQKSILDSLENSWDREFGLYGPTGPRLFIRYIDRSPKHPSWDDWKLAGLKSRTGGIIWDPDRLPPKQIRDSIRENVELFGENSGRVTWDKLTVWWCMSDLDGPSSPRVSDWAGGESLPGRKQ